MPFAIQSWALESATHSHGWICVIQTQKDVIFFSHFIFSRANYDVGTIHAPWNHRERLAFPAASKMGAAWSWNAEVGLSLTLFFFWLGLKTTTKRGLPLGFGVGTITVGQRSCAAPWHQSTSYSCLTLILARCPTSTRTAWRNCAQLCEVLADGVGDSKLKSQQKNKHLGWDTLLNHTTMKLASLSPSPW